MILVFENQVICSVLSTALLACGEHLALDVTISEVLRGGRQTWKN